MRTLQLQNDAMAVAVTIDADGTITDVAPIVRRFVGQPLANLQRWMARHSMVVQYDLEEINKWLNGRYNAEETDRFLNGDIEEVAGEIDEWVNKNYPRP